MISFRPHDKDLIDDFKNNILQSHFTVSNRGAGNCSMRLYQVLSLGRIPILLDSYMVFPLEDEINWDQYLIRAKTEKELVAKYKLIEDGGTLTNIIRGGRGGSLGSGSNNPNAKPVIQLNIYGEFIKEWGVCYRSR